MSQKSSKVPHWLGHLRERSRGCYCAVELRSAAEKLVPALSAVKWVLVRRRF